MRDTLSRLGGRVILIVLQPGSLRLKGDSALLSIVAALKVNIPPPPKCAPLPLPAVVVD